MARRVVFEPEAWQEFEAWGKEDAKIQERIYELIREIQRQPFKGLGKPEPLKHDMQGYWSRRIDKTNRLVYEVVDDSINIVSCMYHYNK